MAWMDIAGRMDKAIMGGLNDGECEYQGAEGGAISAPYMLERDIELYGDDGPGRIASTIDIRTKDIGGTKSHQGDTIVTASRTWRVVQVISDDGCWRKLEVT